MVNRIIGEYLQSNKRLIIPEFGAFIKKDEEGNIVFVPFLKKDDGVLAEKLSARYGLTEAEAKAVVDDYIFNIRKTVGANGFFAIDNIGRLKMDGNNTYYLDYNASERGDGNMKPQPQAQAQAQPRPALVTPLVEEAFVAQSKPAADAQRAEPTHRQPQPQKPAQVQQQRTIAQDQQMRQPIQSQRTAPQNQQIRQPAQPQRTAPQGQQMRQPGQQQPQRRPGQPRPGQKKPRQTSSKIDKIIIVAILAAAIAIASIIFSVVTNMGETRKVEVELAPATTPATTPAAN